MMTSKTPTPPSAPDRTFPALVSVRNERCSQDAKWGTQRHSWPEWMIVLGEEYGEACQAAVKLNWHYSGDDDMADFRNELVRLAAVAVAIVEHIDELQEGISR